MNIRKKMMGVSLAVSLALTTVMVPATEGTVSVYATETTKKAVQISSQKDFEAIAKNMDGNYVLTKDLVFTDKYVPIGSLENQFHGTFDGNGHSITLKITKGGDYTGLFASISGATVKNLTIKGTVKANDDAYSVGALTGFSWNSVIQNVVNEATVSGHHCVGGIVGWLMYGNLSECVNYGTIKASGARIGGIVGELKEGGLVHNSVNYGAISGSWNSKDFTFVGGIAGSMTSALGYNLANYGSVTSKGKGAGGIAGDVSGDLATKYYSYLMNCYNQGVIEGYAFAGGINGGNTHGWIENCVNIGSASVTATNDDKKYIGPISGHTADHLPRYDVGEKKNNYFAKNTKFADAIKKPGEQSAYFSNIYSSLSAKVTVGKTKYSTPLTALNAWVKENQSKKVSYADFSLDNSVWSTKIKPAVWVIQDGKPVIDMFGGEVSTYIITYMLKGGTNNAKNVSNVVSTKEVVLQNPTKKGYTFGGWYTDETFTKKITKVAKGNLKPVTVYAKWIRK